MLNKVDCIRIMVSDIEQALSFYRDKLGLELVWRKGESEAGLKMADSDSELVLIRESLECPEVDFKVDSVQSAVEKFKSAGGKVVVRPFEIDIGYCSVVEDPWKNRYVILDSSKGPLKVDSDRNVI